MVRGIDIKFQQLVGFFRGQSDAGIVALSMICKGDCEEEEGALVEFTATFGYRFEAAGKSTAGGVAALPGQD